MNPGKNPFLLNTKLSRPGVSNRIIVRPRLIDRLDKGLDKRITLISAPAGFGKTTLAVQWLYQSPLRSAWLSLEGDDGELERFLRYVVAAIRTAVPEFGVQVWTLLSAVHLPPPEYLVDVMVSEAGVLDTPVLLVLDDYYLVRSEPVQEMVVRMVQNLPRNLRLAVLTRVDPPWPLARWRSQEWISEFRAAELRFSEDETRTFFKKYKFPPETVDTLHEQSEGWIAGLQLMKLSLDNDGDPGMLIRNPASNYRFIVDYLMDEVIARQSREMVNFLSITALFERFCAPLCDLVLADADFGTNGERILARLEQENLFLVPLDRERRWYRYHHLFRDLLREKLTGRMPPKQRAHLLRRAGEWFAREKMIEESIRHYLNAGDVDDAAGLLGANLDTLIYGDLSRRTLMRWLKMFPGGAERGQPALLVAHACNLVFTWDFAGLLSSLDSAHALLHDPQCSVAEPLQRILQTKIDAMYGFYFYWTGDTQRSLHHALRALNAVPRNHHWTHMLAIYYAAGSLAAKGDYEEAMQLISEKLLEDCSAGSLNAGQILLLKAAINYYAGNLDGVREAAEKVLESHQTVPIPDYWLLNVHYFLGSVAYERNLLDAAVDHFSCVERMIYDVNASIYHDSIIGLALAARAGKEPEMASKYAEKARSFAVEMKAPGLLRQSDSLFTRLTLLAGTIPNVSPADLTGHDANLLWLEIPSLTRAEYLVNRSPEDCSKTILFIEQALLQARKYHNTRQVIQFLAVKAVALKCAGRSETALRVLQEALDMARPLGFIRTFLDRGPRMAELMQSLLKKNRGDRYLRDLVVAFDAEGSAGNQPVGTHEASREVMQEPPAAGRVRLPELTNRELDVLALLEQRLSNKEIAERLRVSPDTARKHTINIYRKLEVNKRTKAVVEARRLGMLPR